MFYNNVLPSRLSVDQAINNQFSCHFRTKVDCNRLAEQWVVVGTVGGKGFNERKFIRKAKG